ncbi:MAG: ABC transporter ATP-binding protein [Clostridia bacterium]|nr:ABC transporter ATP-binding protein [Clostridia bacterium]
MKQNTARKWIWQTAKPQLPFLVLLIFGNALSSVCAVSVALFSKWIVDAAQNGDLDRLFKTGFGLLAIVILQIALRILDNSLSVRISGKLEMACKRRLFSAILQKEYSAVTVYHSGELMTRLTSDITVVTDNATVLLPTATAMVTRLVFAFAVIVSLDVRFALLLLAAGVLLFVFTRAFRSKIKKLHKAVQASDGRLRAFLQESIESLLAVQVFGVQDKVTREADVRQSENFDAKIRRNRWSIAANAGFLAVFSFGTLFTLLWCGWRLAAGAITFGTLTALLQLVNQVQTPLTNLSGLMPKYYSMLSSAERLLEIEDLPDEAQTGAKTMPTQDFESARFRGVSFAYGQNEVFTDADFEIRKQDFVVISGISGIGKSTLFKLLLGVLTPDGGEITVTAGGRTYPADKNTRGLFAYVPQGNLLFSGTVRDNIRFIKEDATDEEVLRAAKIACADTFIDELPAGLDTLLGEGGSGLSEGQMQRIAVARAILTDAPVLLLDEATSALDEETEARLLQNIRALENKTCLIISHKKAAYAVCTRELTVKDGTVRDAAQAF